MRQIDIDISATPDDTRLIAKKYGKVFKPGDTVLLEGDLGSGKTFFVQEICRIWKTEDEASSPTFAIIHQYQGPQPVNHLDLYRIEHVRELDQLGWEELLESEAVTFIEWPQIIVNQIDRYYKINIILNNDQREFNLSKTE